MVYNLSNLRIVFQHRYNIKAVKGFLFNDVISEENMRNTIFITLFILFGTFAAAAQVSWLDRPLTDWNTSATVPRAPRDVAIESRCRSEIRTPESLADRA
jgi:hypothetical protein